ncbi:urea ABC transporter substrate-binding protein [Ectothiorhodospira magna]|nr:urea ABC transporter substrate-binding protein [Ectothiorhodospira magna]
MGHRRMLLAWLLALGLGAGLLVYFHRSPPPDPILIGVIHGLTGNMAVSELPLVQSITLAVEEINQQGGLLGRPVAMIVADSQSDPDIAAQEAERLILEAGVSALFACWTSACRKAVKPVVERHQHLMFYPLQYEGLEQSPHIIYGGLAPNQQIIPGTRWALDHWGNRVYLLGSDYIFPRTAHVIIKDLIRAVDGQVVGERYVPLGDDQMADIMAELAQLSPDVIVNTINGVSNLALFRALHQSNLTHLPIVSFSVAERELASMPDIHHPNHFAVWGYFQSLDTPGNRAFVQQFQTRFGADETVSDPMEAAYVNVKLWAQAVQTSGSITPEQVNQSVLLQSVPAPSGIVSIDGGTRHAWRMSYVGQARPDGQFDIVFSLPDPIRPMPFPGHRPLHVWQQIAQRLSADINS